MSEKIIRNKLRIFLKAKAFEHDIFGYHKRRRLKIKGYENENDMLDVFGPEDLDIARFPRFRKVNIDETGRPYVDATAREAREMIPILLKREAHDFKNGSFKGIFDEISEKVVLIKGRYKLLPETGTFSFNDLRFEIIESYDEKLVCHVYAPNLEVLSAQLKAAEINSCLHDHGDLKQYS